MRAAAIVALIAAGGLIGPRALSQLPIMAIEANEQEDIDLTGLGNLLNNPTDFLFACGQHTGQVVEATVDDDHLTIEIAYPSGFRLESTTITGHLTESGIFNGTYQTRWVKGTFSGDVLLSFADDGSAQGIHQNSGRKMAIQKVNRTRSS